MIRAFFLEGGYSLAGLAKSVGEVIKVLLSEKDYACKEEDYSGIENIIEKAIDIHNKYMI